MAALFRPDVFFGVAFNADPFDGTAVPTWSDLTARAVSIGSASRGRQYELDQNQAGAMDVLWRNADEALNPTNTGSPFSPNVLPYRQILARCMWPNGGTGNLVNATYNIQSGVGTDGSFESYAVGVPPAWLLYAGTGVQASAAITTANPQQGTKCLTYNVVNGGGTSGVAVTIPCIPGRQYTSSWYVRQTGANTTQIFINNGPGGTSTSATGAYVRLTLTWTATQPTHQLWVASFGTSVNSTVNVDAVQHEPGGSASAFTTTGPLIRNIWTRGYVERWPSQWDPDSAGFEGQSTTPCVGPFALLANIDMHTEYRSTVLAKAPTYYHPLQEPQAAVAFADASGNNAPPLVRFISQAGAGTAYVAGSEAAAGGDPGGVGVKFTPTSPNQRQGTFIGAGFNATGVPNPVNIGVPPLPATPGGLWSATWAALVQANPVTYTDGSGTLMFIAYQAGGTSLAAPFYVIVLNGGTVQAAIHGHGADVLAISSTTITDGAWHHILITASQDAVNSTMTLYIDGVLAATATALTSTVQLFSPSAQCYTVGVITGGGNALSPLDGTISHPAMWYRTLTPTEITDLANAAMGYPGETSGARTARQLALGGYIGPTTIQAGASTMGASSMREGDSLLSAGQRNADSEFGNFFESQDGAAFAGRNDRYLKTTPAYTFGENAAGGEYPYEGDIQFDTDPQLVLNIADVTRTGGIRAHAEDPTGASQKRYGKKTFTRTIDIASDNETQDAATWVVANRKDPLTRVASVTFNPAATTVPFGDGSIWPMVLSIEIGTRVTVKRRPKAANAGAGITMSGDFFVENITHHDIDFEAGTWLTTLLLSPVARAQPWILQDAVYGQLDVTTVLGF